MSKRGSFGSGGGSGGGGLMGGVGGGASSLEHDVIVLDIGTGSIKVGWGGEDAPRVVVPTLLLDHQGQAMPAGAAAALQQMEHHAERNEYAVGHAALQALHMSSTRLGNNAANNLTLLRPVHRGEIRDYDSMQKILDYIFKHELRVNPKDHPVMLTVSPLCSPESRAELAKLMFDVFAVPSLCMANQAVLSLYSTGRTTGLVLELGEGMSYAVPVYEGFALRHAVLSIPVAGADLTAFLGRSLAERGWASMDASASSSSSSGLGGGGSGNNQGNPAQADTVRDIKEKLCRVKGSKWEYNVIPIPSSNAATALAQASNPAASSASAGSGGDSSMDETSYELPDGQMIRLDEHCRFNTLEILFAPDKYAQAMGVHLSGGVNQSYGIPPQSASAGGMGMGGVGGGSGAPGSAGGMGGAGGLAGSPSAGGGVGASGSGPPTPSTNIPMSLRDFSSFSSQGGGGGGGARHGGGGGGGGAIPIDLSTNDLIGVHLMVHHSLGMCDSFLRRDLLKNIVLAGGTSMARGFGERMKRELHALLAQDAAQAQAQAGGAAAAAAAQAASQSGSGDDGASDPAAPSIPPLNIITDSQRKYAAWIGASMYASLPTFNIIKITADQYKRDENIVHKKFF